jgi:hypothetical protein
MFTVIGRVVGEDERAVIGFVVYDRESKKASPQGVVTIKEMYVRNPKAFDNIVLKDGSLRGLNCNLTKLPSFTSTGVFKGKPSVYIDARVKNGNDTVGFVLLTHLGVSTVRRYDDVVKLIKAYGSSNAKLVPRGDCIVISAISGEFKEIPVEDLRNKSKKPVVQPKVTENSTTKWRSKQYLHDLFFNTLCGNYMYDIPLSASLNSYNVTVNLLEGRGSLKVGDTTKLRGYKQFLCVPLVLEVARGNYTELRPILDVHEKNDAVVDYILGRLEKGKSAIRKQVERTNRANKYVRTYNAYAEIYNGGESAYISIYNRGITDRGSLGETEGYMFKYIMNRMKPLISVGLYIKGEPISELSEEDLEAINTHVRIMKRTFETKLTVCKKPLDKLRTTSIYAECFGKFNAPLLDEYVRHGVLDFVIEYGVDTVLYNKYVTDRKSLLEHLDVIFLETFIKKCNERSYFTASRYLRQTTVDRFIKCIQRGILSCKSVDDKKILHAMLSRYTGVE